MPEANLYVPPTDKLRGGYYSNAAKERRQRRTKYLRALRYYSGDHKKMLPIERDSEGGEIDDNVVLNMAEITCDRVTQFLFPEEPLFVVDIEGEEDSPEEQYIHKTIEANGGLSMLVSMAQIGFLAGHVFCKVSMPENTFFGSTPAFPRITVLDPMATTVFWRQEDSNRVLWYETRYRQDDYQYLEDYLRIREDYWVIYRYRSTHKDESFLMDLKLGTTFGPDRWELFDIGSHTSVIPPIIEWGHLPNPNSRYGLSGFEDTQYFLQNRINENASRMNAVVRKYTSPVDVVTGVDSDADVEEGDGIFFIRSDRARVNRLSLSGDLTGINNALDRLVDSYKLVTRVVLQEGEAKDLQRVTNAAVRTLFLDAVAQNKLLASSYGIGLQKIASIVLQMGYLSSSLVRSPDALEIEIKFPVALPIDESEIANQNQLAIGSGYMSRHTAAERLGLDPRFEFANIAQDRQDDLDHEQQQAEQIAALSPEPAVSIQDET